MRFSENTPISHREGRVWKARRTHCRVDSECGTNRVDGTEGQDRRDTLWGLVMAWLCLSVRQVLRFEQGKGRAGPRWVLSCWWEEITVGLSGDWVIKTGDCSSGGFK